MATGSSKLGVAIFGLGRAGQIHFRNAVKDCSLDLLYAVDERTEHAQKLVDESFQSQCVVLAPSHSASALNDERVDFVMVCTPTFLHEQITLDALKAGKGVFCEKPIAASDEAVTNCYDAAEAAGKPLFCSFNRRYDPSLRKVYSSLGEVGQIQMVKSCARDSPFPPLAYLAISGGVFHDCLVHDIDLICWVMDDYPVQVFAAAHCFCDEIGAMDDVDTVAAVMKFKSGALAIIDTSRDAKYGYDQRIEVFGDKGMVLNQNIRPNNMIVENMDGQKTGRMYNSFNDRYEQSYVEALNHFCRVLRGEEEIEITKKNTLNISKIASALEESSKSGLQVTLEY